MTNYTTGASAYTDNSPFVRVLRTEGQVRVLDALLGNPERPLSVSTLVEKTGMVRSTVIENIERLEVAGLVEQADRIGNVNRYQVTSHSANKHFHQAQLALVTEKQSRSSAPEPRKHKDQKRQEKILGTSFGEAPDTHIGSFEPTSVAPSD